MPMVNGCHSQRSFNITLLSSGEESVSCCFPKLHSFTLFQFRHGTKMFTPAFQSAPYHQRPAGNFQHCWLATDFFTLALCPVCVLSHPFLPCFLSLTLFPIFLHVPAIIGQMLCLSSPVLCTIRLAKGKNTILSTALFFCSLKRNNLIARLWNLFIFFE